jgi:[amino group carrier protein]-lysine/ornithine hydrolase
VSYSYAVEFLKSSLEKYTPSRAEASLATVLKDKCVNELGFEEAYIDSVGNMIATKGNGAPRILLCGHMDTVPGSIPVRIQNGYIYGRGASDAKAPLISMLLAASEFPKQRGTIILAAVVDEEGNATGIKHLVSKNLDVNYAIFGEPSGINKITVAYKGRLAIRLVCDVGNSAHASAPWMARNSIEEMSTLWGELRSEIISSESLKSGSDSVTCAITEIEGGSSHNVTPQRCKATIDIRIPVGTTCDELLRRIDLVVSRVSKSRGIGIKYRTEDRTEPFESEYRSVLVRALSLSILDVCKTRPSLIRKTGTGDMNILGNALKMPAVTYGPGDPRSSHTANERIKIQEYISSIEIYIRSLFHISRIHHLKNGLRKGL